MNYSALKGLLLVGLFLICSRSAFAQNADVDANGDAVADRGIQKPSVKVSDITHGLPTEKSPDALLVELIGSEASKPVPLFSSPEAKTSIGQLDRGQIVSVSRKSENLAGAAGWRKILVDGSEEIWFQYDAAFMKTLNADDGIDLRLKPSDESVEQPLYRTPGLWTPEDCDRDPAICVSELPPHSVVQLHQTQFRHVDRSGKKGRLWLNFYEVSQPKTIDSDGHHGWILSNALTKATATARPETTLEGVQNAEQGNPADGAAASPPEPQVKFATESGMFLFESTSATPGRRKQLVEDLKVPDLVPENVAGLSGLTLRSSAGAGPSYLDVDQPFAGPETQLQCAKLTGTVSTYLFLDLQMKFTVDFSLPLATSDKTQSAQGYYFDSQQWFTYTTRWKVNRAPVKLGLGAYYIGLGTGKTVGGLPGLVGFQSKVIFEGKKLGTGLRYAPVAQDLSFNPKNRILGLEFVYSFDWHVDDEPVQLKFSFDDIYFKNPVTDNSTALRVVGLSLNVPLKF